MGKIRIVFVLFFLSLFMEGVVRKWIMPSFPSMAAFAIKYLLLLLLAFYLRKENLFGLVPERLTSLFRAFIIIVLFWAFIIGMFYNGPLAAIVASIQYCAPIAIVYAIAFLIRDRNQLNNFLCLMIIVLIPVFVLAFIQYFSPSSSLINRYGVEETKYIAMVGSSVRVTSVFSYITPFGDCCVFVSVFTLCLMMNLKEYDKNAKRFIIILYLFSLIGGFMSGARMVVGMLGIYTLLIAFMFTRRGNFKLLALLGVFGIIAVYIYFEFGLAFVDNFLMRVDSASDDTGGRIGKMLSYEKMFGYSGLLGFGSGFASNALQPLLTFKSPVYFEEELGRIILEFGAIGGIMIVVIRLAILKNVYDYYTTIHIDKIKGLSLGCFLSIIPMSVFLQLCLYNWFAYMCYYIFIGISVAVKNIEENEEYQSDLSPSF